MKLKVFLAAGTAALLLGACARSTTAPLDPSGAHVRADGTGMFGSGNAAPPPDSTGSGH